jgi:fatty-acyl-CoA synthase
LNSNVQGRSRSAFDAVIGGSKPTKVGDPESGGTLTVTANIIPTVGTQTLRALARYPDRIAFAWDGGTLSYRGATDLIGRFQRVYENNGLSGSRRIALLAGNCALSWCASVAAQLCGIGITWLHQAASLSDQLTQLEDAEVDGLVADTVHFGARSEELAAKAPSLLHFRIGPGTVGTDLLAAADRAGSTSPRDMASADDIALLSYTGGTTGRPKGAMRRHRAVTPWTSAILADFEFPQTPRYLTAAPITHVAGLKVLPVLILGGTVHLMTGFDPSRVLTAIARDRINFSLMVPTMIYALLDAPDLERSDLSSLELLLYGAAAMAPSRLEEGLRRIGPVFSQLYGQTECYPATVLRKADHCLTRPHLFHSCGFPVSSADVRLLDELGQEVATGESGEICIRSPYAMECYWKQDELTAEALKFNWLHTGDVGRRDDEGYLFIVDRKKDMVITGGFNVFPRELEDVLTSHPAVANAAVIGVPDEKWGEAVTAVVVRRPGSDVASEALIQLVKDRKGSVHAPKHVHFVETLPTTALGKVDKKALRTIYGRSSGA